MFPTPTDGSSARPSGNAYSDGNAEGCDARFDGPKGMIVFAIAFRRWWMVLLPHAVGRIVSERRRVRHGRNALEAEMIRIHPLVGEGWICIISRRLEGLRRRAEASEGCHCKSDAAGDVQVQSPIWLVSARKMDFGVVQYTK